MSRLLFMVIIAGTALAASTEPRSVSGIYPQLAMFNNEGECGTGAVVPWAGRLWSIGWDHRSLILMLLDRGQWHAFRLPKATHCYDGAHGWNTEWPRIRDIGESALLMTMHGSFWKFPKTFSAANSVGIASRSTYLKVVGDFCRWGDRLVLGCDDAAKSEFINADSIKGKVAGPGKSQSNLWFVEPTRLDACGPALGRGAVWLDDEVKASTLSEPFLFAGFAHKRLTRSHTGREPVVFRVEADFAGTGQWAEVIKFTVPPGQTLEHHFPDAFGAYWLRLITEKDTTATAKLICQ